MLLLVMFLPNGKKLRTAGSMRTSRTGWQKREFGIHKTSRERHYYMQQHGGPKPSRYTCAPTRYVLPTTCCAPPQRDRMENLCWSYFLQLVFAHVWTYLSPLDAQFTRWTTTYRQGRKSTSGTSAPALESIWGCHPSTLGL